MNNACPQPGCDATYDLSQQAAGTQFACTKCGRTLVVSAEGLALAPGTASPPAPNAAGPSPLQTYLDAAPRVLDRVQRMGDVSTWLFASGALISLCALFFPLIDQAKVSRLEAMVVAGDMKQERRNAQVEREIAAEKDKAAAEAAKAAAEKVKERWLERKDDLSEYVENAELSRRGWTYYYRYLTLLGFGLLLIGSFRYLDSSQNLMRRILGCIVLAATVLVVLNALARTSFRLEIGPF